MRIIVQSEDLSSALLLLSPNNQFHYLELPLLRNTTNEMIAIAIPILPHPSATVQSRVTFPTVKSASTAFRIIIIRVYTYGLPWLCIRKLENTVGIISVLPGIVVVLTQSFQN